VRADAIRISLSCGLQNQRAIPLERTIETPTVARMEWITTPEAWISLLTLTLLEIVLGIDNIVFISLLSTKLPQEQQKKARQMGLLLALGTRILLLLGLAFMAKMQKELFNVFGHGFTGRDLVLLIGGLFLIWKATREIHEKLEGEDGEVTSRITPTFVSVIVQILLLDIVFSLDSVITAIGMAKHIPVMIAAVILAVMFMLVFAGKISGFIEQHPTLKMLALSFLIMIGFTLVLEGFHKEIPKGYIYFAMAFSVGVEVLNINMRKRAREKVKFHQPYR
jgi:predicted tellurium resistance membrane protein TerC